MKGEIAAGDFVIFAMAILIDVLGLLCLFLDILFGIGEIFSFILDISGFIIFGLWALAKGESLSISSVKKKGKAARAAKKALAKKIGKRFAFTFIGELIPFLGALPFWTIFVYSIIKSS